jgi:hypothetical protein
VMRRARDMAARARANTHKIGEAVPVPSPAAGVLPPEAAAGAASALAKASVSALM